MKKRTRLIFILSACILCPLALITIGILILQYGSIGILLTLRGISQSVQVHVYGQIIDQFGQPVVDVKVTGGTSYFNGSSVGSNVFSVQTDDQGKFDLLAHGMGITLNFQKDGYSYSGDVPPKIPGRGYTDSTPNNRVIITMWKLNGPEPVISMDKRFTFSHDGKAYTIDLVKGTASATDSGGDLRVTMDQSSHTSTQGYPVWPVMVEAVDGGVIETSIHTYLNEAPKDGYQPKIDDPNGALWAVYYLKSRDGMVYGYFIIDISSFDKETRVNVRSLINPAGSRVLESVPEKTFKAGSPQALALLSK